MAKICRDCGKPFEKKTVKAGYINQCNSCSLKSGDANKKYLGRPGLTNKDGSITIFRTDLPFVKAVIRRENAIGPTANLNISSPGQIAAQEKYVAMINGEEE